MRFVRVTHYYEAYIKAYEAKHPEAAALPYASQLNLLLNDCFDAGFFWQQVLPQIGYETEVLVANYQGLQKTWAQERGLQIDSDRWKEEIVLHQLKSLDPEVVWLDDLHLFKSAFVKELREALPKVRLWMAWSGSPLPRNIDLKPYDLILSNIPEQITQFRALGQAAEFLPHAFSEKVNELLGQPEPVKDPFTFVGSLFSGAGGHNSRLELLAYLMENSPLQMHSMLSGQLLKKPRKLWLYHHMTRAASLFYKPEALPEKWRKRHFAYLVKDRILPPVFGLEMFRKLQTSQVTLNQHIDVSRAAASNMRLFEATGVGTCLLTDWKSNLADFFELDREVVTYKSREECLEKYSWLSQHPEERRAIALAGQKRTLKSHTFFNRASVLKDILPKYL